MAYNKIKLMKTEEIKTNIQNSIKAFNSGNLTQNGLDFFSNLGYNTQRNAPLVYPTYEDFQNSFIVEQKFDKTKAKIDEWKYVDLLFQLSKEEISQQVSLFDTQQVDKTIIETYLFFVIELSKEDYTRTELSNITREINRLFPMPVMVLFKYGKKLTLSVINRRLHKRDDSKDVLEKVTLIKDIAIDNPIRAHIEILYDLTFQELYDKFHFTNFVELHNAWQKTLDTKELNKRFYNELFNWYLWAVEKVRFPNDVNDDKDDKVYNAESVIRLLTRLIFVWFIKEKRLVPETIFNLTNLKSILKDFNPHSEESSIFYRAILQNLFFATLNTPMDRDINDDNKNEKRRFINTLPKVGNDQYLDQTKYRYQDYFIHPEKALELFSDIPFLNGGLFECLDFREGNKEIRYDGFSSTESKQAFVADRLFFADEFDIDLNTEYGTKGKKFKVEGLIKILDSYKFTITENTPLEEEIALDPELLGKVFENLLASYNPETKTTARKQTGSFYTPREIVNYMVDESLLAYFKQKLDNSDDTEVRLRDLFAHSYNLPEFSTTEKEIIIKSISDVKILDPACGSGAFPMGVLHRLVDLLNKLDPENKGWNDIQIQRAISETAEVFKHESDSEERRIRLKEIEKAFDLNINNPDYARKLFLIENCIYGVDIQQIAIQISKLRFFISLIVDQKVNDNKPNRNILSMPNLETKFVAANTLIGLDKPLQISMIADKVEHLEKELSSIRHKIFFTRKYSEKKLLKGKEKEKREELKEALIESGFGETVATQKAGWNPFDPMKSAGFFDPETMFGFTDGFDVVLGNPPYGADIDMYVKFFKKLYPKTSNGFIDIYKYFFDKGILLLKGNGHLCYITPSTFLRQPRYGDLRRLLLEFGIKKIVDLGEDIFEAVVPTSISLISKQKTNIVLFADLTKESDLNIALGEIDFGIIEQEMYHKSNNNIFVRYIRLKKVNEFFLEDILEMKDAGFKYQRSKVGLSQKGNNDLAERIFYNGESKSKQDIPILIGKDINSFYYNKKPSKKLRNNYLDLLKSNEGTYYNKKIMVEPCKLIWRQTAPYFIGTVLNDKIFFGNTIQAGIIKEIFKQSVNYEFLCGLLNSKYLRYLYEQNVKEEGRVFPQVKLEKMKKLPIIIEQTDTLTKLVLEIIALKENDVNVNTSRLEKQIDEMVYELYGLTEEEKRIVEGKV